MIRQRGNASRKLVPLLLAALSCCATASADETLLPDSTLVREEDLLVENDPNELTSYCYCDYAPPMVWSWQDPSWDVCFVFQARKSQILSFPFTSATSSNDPLDGTSTFVYTVPKAASFVPYCPANSFKLGSDEILTEEQLSKLPILFYESVWSTDEDNFTVRQSPRKLPPIVPFRIE